MKKDYAPHIFQMIGEIFSKGIPILEAEKIKPTALCIGERRDKKRKTIFSLDLFTYPYIIEPVGEHARPLFKESIAESRIKGIYHTILLVSSEGPYNLRAIEERRGLFTGYCKIQGKLPIEEPLFMPISKEQMVYPVSHDAYKGFYLKLMKAIDDWGAYRGKGGRIEFTVY